MDGATLTLVGVGWEYGQLTLDAMKALREASRVILQTGRCGCAQWLREQGIHFSTLDDLYESCEDFDEFTAAAVNRVLDGAAQCRLAYAASELNDQVASRLASAAPSARLVPGVPSGGALTAFAGSGLRVVSAIDYEDFVPSAWVATLVTELDSPMYASEMKLKLMGCYPEEHAVLIQEAEGVIRRIPLCELDRLDNYDHRLCALVPAVDDLTALERYDFDALCRIVRRLRAIDGCPWDKEQTHESLRPCLVEEAYEAVDAIDREDSDSLYDELGDVLLQVALHAEIARQHGEFDISDVTTAICKKMIRRHPHIFAGQQVDDIQDTWDAIKKQESQEETQSGMMRRVAHALPALSRARKVLSKADRAGHEEDDPQAAAATLSQCASQLARDIAAGTNTEKAAGEMLLRAVNLIRIGKTEPELALNQAIEEYIASFEAEETRVTGENADPDQ